jgi:DNA mismatch endonuclease (patch repair protein)
MADFLNVAERSVRMAAVRQRGTSPELQLRRQLHRLGYRFRINVRGLPGCFWHRHHGCNSTTTPKSNIDFWQEKFEKNVERDARKHKELENLGWNVYIVWSCEISTEKKAVAKALEIDELICTLKKSI